jgi:Ferritin-like domain
MSSRGESQVGSRMNRRAFFGGSLGVSALALGGQWVPTASAATEDELALANFGASTEFLVKDFYTRALEAKVVSAAQAATLKRGRSAAGQHAKALSDLLRGAGDVAPAPEDFDFQWPAGTFRSEKEIVATGTAVLRALLGAYQTAAASVSTPAYRVLYASLAASVSQQLATLAARAGQNAIEPFPAAMDLEAASDALEAYLG